MTMNKVKADVQCPYCGCCKTVRPRPTSKSVMCPECRQWLFLSWATGKKGELDKHGFYFHAYELFNVRGINREFRGVFDAIQSYSLLRQHGRQCPCI